MAELKKHSLTELFGWFVHMPMSKDLWDYPRPCMLCGSAVLKPDAHRVWHDKQV